MPPQQQQYARKMTLTMRLFMQLSIVSVLYMGALCNLVGVLQGENMNDFVFINSFSLASTLTKCIDFFERIVYNNIK